MNQEIFSLSGFDVTVFQLILCAAIVLGSIFIYHRITRLAITDLTDIDVVKPNILGLKIRLFFTLIFMATLLILRLLNFDLMVWEIDEFSFTLNHIIEILALFSMALLFDWFISHVIIRNKFLKREIPKRTNFQQDHNNEFRATKLVRYIVYLYLGQILLKRLELDAVLFQREIKKELFTIHLSDLLVAIMIVLAARVIVWFITQVTLYRMYRKADMDEGIQYAINQLVMYIIYVVAILFAMNRLVSDMSIIYGGAAALLVGIGLGLQQTFNDFFSGLVLLFERTVMVGDILEVDGQVGRILKIGLRASRMETRNSVSLLIPNSKLVNQAVTNWTHYDNIVRFQVDVSVAYGTDTEVVRDLLMKASAKVHDVLKTPLPFVRLNHFGDNGLEFSLYFFSTNVMTAENVRSDVRFEIDKLFREHDISIPFPQRDVWFKNEAVPKDKV
ncbi:MAG: mechanosensitive ion channel domain-containing protein [Saprospiraceae bacterium]